MSTQTSITLGHRFIATAKRRWSSPCMTDSSGRSLTFGETLTASRLLALVVQRRCAGEVHIGLLVPASVGGALANIAVALSGKTAVNLNFTAGREAMQHAVERCSIQTIITSRLFLSKASIEPMDGMVYLEDMLGDISGIARAWTFILGRALPTWLLARMWTAPQAPERNAAVIFSSGSTGIPKGVMLSHHNIVSNIESIDALFRTRPTDVLLGVLPFFHSFGYTATIWLPLVAGFAVAYHANPMDAKTIGELAGRHRATLLIATPTFCSAYVRKCERAQFASLRIAVVGAEKLREPIARAFAERFGITLIEGYGCTEMAPGVAINVVPTADGRDVEPGRAGSVGRPLPGIDARVVEPTTGEGPLVGQEGLLLLRGPNLMIGYIGEEARTREVIRDGWYVTGDVARIDQDGFITITDRLARFSKIAGEMVPHMKVEDTINALVSQDSASAVTGVPDASKGERLVAFYTDRALKPADVWEQLGKAGLPRLWIPKREDIHFIESIPTLGTGKMDLKGVRTMALAFDDAPAEQTSQTGVQADTTSPHR